MKRKMKKFMSILTSLAMVTAVTSNVVNATDFEADIFYVVIDELDEDGNHCQWYTTDIEVFRTKGISVKMDGVDCTDKSYFQFEKDVRPGKVYDGKNFDYEVPFNVTSNGEPLDAILPVKIGQEGDVNLDHKVDARDSSAISRDVKYFRENKKSRLNEFGIYLGEPLKETTAYGLSTNTAVVIAKDLALAALERADGEKYENNGESKYSLSLSKVNGLPGETVTVQVIVDADDEFESLDALIEWDDDTLKSAGAVSVNGTLCESYAEDGMVSIVDYSEGAVKDGAIASIDFVIPENAVPGTSLDVYFSSVETFAVYDSENDMSVENANVVNVVGTSIKVLEPRQTTPAVTTATPVTTTTATTTTVPVTTANSLQTDSSVSTTPVVTTTTPVITTITTTVKTTPAVTTTIIVKPVEQGDANLDGKIDVRDAAYIAYVLSRGEGNILHNIADYNYDGKKDVRDAAAIAKMLSVGISKK